MRCWTVSNVLPVGAEPPMARWATNDRLGSPRDLTLPSIVLHVAASITAAKRCGPTTTSPGSQGSCLQGLQPAHLALILVPSRLPRTFATVTGHPPEVDTVRFRRSSVSLPSVPGTT